MKKLALAVAAAALSSTAIAEVGVDASLGYQSSTVSHGLANSEAQGYVINVKWQPKEVEGLYVLLDRVDIDGDKNQFYSNFSADKVKQTIESLVLEGGFATALNETVTVSAGLRRSDISWSLKFDGVEYEAEDDGFSLVAGVAKQVSNDVEIGASFFQGYENGIGAYIRLALTEQVSLETSYSRSEFDLDEYEFESFDLNEDADFDMESFRVSAIYSF